MFEAAEANFYGVANSDLLVGVNLVGSEIDTASLRDYWWVCCAEISEISCAVGSTIFFCLRHTLLSPSGTTGG